MIEPKAASIYSTGFDVDTFSPPNPEMFCEWLTVDVEAREGDRIVGADEFSLGVCSPSWIVREAGISNATWGRGYLILRVWDVTEIHRRVDNLCAASSAADWPTVTQKLLRYMKAEFEDIVDD
jgi:hypothetical protein